MGMCDSLNVQNAKTDFKYYVYNHSTWIMNQFIFVILKTLFLFFNGFNVSTSCLILNMCFFQH